MKRQEDKHRPEREFQVGGWVYIKLQPHVQQSVQRCVNHKLSFKYFGPYQVLQHIGKVAYKLQLPESSKIHPVLHVSQLKKEIPPHTKVAADDQLQLLTIDAATASYKVLDSCLRKIGNAAVPHLLLQWEGWPSTWATWECLHCINIPS
jgi:hypothetical protein